MKQDTGSSLILYGPPMLATFLAGVIGAYLLGDKYRIWLFLVGLLSVIIFGMLYRVLIDKSDFVDKNLFKISIASWLILFVSAISIIWYYSVWG